MPSNPDLQWGQTRGNSWLHASKTAGLAAGAWHRACLAPNLGLPSMPSNPDLNWGQTRVNSEPDASKTASLAAGAWHHAALLLKLDGWAVSNTKL
jgi:hypothetical protein